MRPEPQASCVSSASWYVTRPPGRTTGSPAAWKPAMPAFRVTALPATLFTTAFSGTVPTWSASPAAIPVASATTIVLEPAGAGAASVVESVSAATASIGITVQ
jgi:hypothetical protein